MRQLLLGLIAIGIIAGAVYMARGLIANKKPFQPREQKNDFLKISLNKRQVLQ